jgi:hypothetical protein
MPNSIGQRRQGEEKRREEKRREEKRREEGGVLLVILLQ